MPIEIREVVIKAQLEKPLIKSDNKAHLSEEKLRRIKAEIMEAIMEKMEERFWKVLNR